MLKIGILVLAMLASANAQGTQLDTLVDQLFGTDAPNINQQIGSFQPQPSAVSVTYNGPTGDGGGGVAYLVPGAGGSANQGTPVQVSYEGPQGNAPAPAPQGQGQVFQGNLQPGNYLWGGWGNYGACSASCGPGQRTRQRVCFLYQTSTSSSGSSMSSLLPLTLLGGGGDGGGLSNIVTLSLVSGGLGGNGGGSTSTQPQGVGCPGLSRESISCLERPCSVQPTLPPFTQPPPVTQAASCYSAWGQYGECSSGCGAAIRIRVRQCTCRNQITGVATCLEPLTQSQTCTGLPPCAPVTLPPVTEAPTVPPIVGTWSNWFAWSGCTNACGETARESRSRFCAGPGTCEGSFQEFRDCPVVPCPTQAPTWSDWGAYASCSATCGPATKTRFRSCPVVGQCNGNSFEVTPCENNPCPTLPPPAVWSDWGPYSACTATCGTANKSRFRSCSVIGQCVGDSFETTACENVPCPTLPPPPVWSNWGPYSACTATCGPANKSRFRSCSVIGQCVGDSFENTACENVPCPTLPPPPVWSDWGPYSACTATCGPATKSRFRSCSVIGLCAGNSFETTACENAPCATLPPPPVWSDWGPYAACTQTCGPATKSRFRSCSVIGRCAGEAIQVTPCGNAPCPTLPPTPVWSVWGPYAACTQTCGPATKSRFRSCSVIGGCVGNAIDITPCENAPCPTLPPPAVWEAWGPFGDCTATCGFATKTRIRSCSVFGQCTGVNVDVMACENAPCPAPPTWGQWSAYGACTATCGFAEKTRVRSCSVVNMCQGDLIDIAQCENIPCPTLPPQASWSDWGPYTECTATCGPAERMRFRSCSTFNQCTGLTFESVPCNNEPCVTASYGDWSDFSACTRSCGSGTQTRIRICVGDGPCAGSSSEVRTCADFPCPTDPPPVTANEFGTWGSYGPWSSCLRNTDGVGCSQTRSRPCIGGVTCEGFSLDIRACTTGQCAVVATTVATTTTTNANQAACDASLPEFRTDCGYPGISREECWDRGCCYSDVVFDVNWCFYDDFSGFGRTIIEGTLEEGDGENNEEEPGMEGDGMGDRA